MQQSSHLAVFSICLAASVAAGVVAPAAGQVTASSAAVKGAVSSSGVVTAVTVLQPGDLRREESDAQSSSMLRSPVLLLTVYCLLIVAVSLLGGWLPSRIKLTHTRMQTIVSFVGGLMLGIGVFHLLPHAAHELNDMDIVALWMMCGVIVMFLMIRIFHFHNHGISESAEETCDPCEKDHQHSHRHSHTHPHTHKLSWLGIVVGLSVHTLIDGIALGSAVRAEAKSTAALLPGVGVFLAVLLHKPLDSLSISALMAAGGWNRTSRQFVNAGFALMCPLGAAIFLLGISRFPSLQRELAGGAMAFSAGIFLCFALSDLLPEMEFHSHHRVRLSLALGLGILAAWTLRFLEPAHIH